ncbi:hypothetical protein [Streptomyces sp. SGAir0957]
MYRSTRHTLEALTAVVLLTGVASGCSDAPDTPTAPEARKTASRTTASSPSAEDKTRARLDEQARTRLGAPDELDERGADFVSSGSLAIPGENLDERVGRGTELQVQVTCAGRGSVTFTAVSGSAKKAVRVDCARSMTNTFDLTTAAPRFAIQADSAEAAQVGTAYLVRQVT